MPLQGIAKILPGQNPEILKIRLPKIRFALAHLVKVLASPKPKWSKYLRSPKIKILASATIKVLLLL